MADAQEEDDHTADFFWKTNLLHKYFKFMKENRRNLIMERILSNVEMKLSFRTIRIFSFQGKKTY